MTQSHTTSSVTAPGTSGGESACPPAARAATASRPFGEQVVAEPHDQELRREVLARRPRRAGILAAAALGARVGVDDLLPGHVRDGARAHPDVLLGALLVEPQRLQPPARAGAPEVDVEDGRHDVQVLGARQVGQEAEDDEDVRPDQHALGVMRPPPAAEQVREGPRDRRPARRPLVQVERDQRGVPQEQRRDDARDEGEDQVGLAHVAALEPGRPLQLADRNRGRPPRRARARRRCPPAARTSPGARATGSSGRGRRRRSAPSGSSGTGPGSPRR